MFSRTFGTILVVLILISSPAFAHNGRISLFSDATGTDCNSTGTPYTIETVHILYIPDNGIPSISGAEFRVDPSSTNIMITNFTPSPAVALYMGSVETGITLAFSGCQSSTPSLWLGSVDVMPLTAGTHHLTVRENPDALPPAINIVDCEIFQDIHPVLGGTFVFNGDCDFDDVWYVKPDGTGETITLQDAIDIAADGETVLASDGTFTGTGNWDLNFGGKAITVTTEHGYDFTTIDCQGSHYGFAFDSGEDTTSVVEGFKLSDGSGYPYGGGISCSSSSPTIRYNWFYQCVASSGSALYCSSGSSPIYGNTFEDNGAPGGEQSAGAVGLFNGVYHFSNNTVTDNITPSYGVGLRAGNSTITITENVFTSNHSFFQSMARGGAIYCDSGIYNITYNTISGNRATSGSGIWISSSDPCDISFNTITSNWTDTDASSVHGFGGGIYCSGTDLMEITDNIIVDNSSFHGGGIYCIGNPLIRDNLIVDNIANYRFFTTSQRGGVGGGIYCAGCSSDISKNTIYSNEAHSAAADYTSYGGGIYVDGTGTPTINNCVVANNELIPAYPGEGGGIYNANLSNPVSISCSDFYNNEREDYAGNITDTTGVNNNISLDPNFCNPDNEEFTLRTDSPCLPGNHPDGGTCGLIGALEGGCYGTWPLIASIRDVLNDQGRQVSIQWHRSGLDTTGSITPILAYEVYRRIDDLPVSPVALSQELITDNSDRDILGYPPGDWHFLFSIPAHGEDLYGFVAPTLEDSCVYNLTDYYSTFFVRATTSIPTSFHDSPIDSGYSVDNLAPGVPLGLAVVYNSSGGTALAWEDNTDEDFKYFKIYRGTDEDFTPAPGDLVHETTSSDWLDTAENSWQYSYKVSTLDHNGNESVPVKPVYRTGSEIDATPKAVTLYQNAPNPFNPNTTIAFDIPRSMNVRLSIYSVAGQLIDVLADSHMSPGRKELNWNGTDRYGRSMASGIYFYRLETGDLTVSKKMVLLR